MLQYRNVVTGLEGCGKSSSVFRELDKIATPEAPVLFGVKNYALMREQVDNWSNRFGIPLDNFAIMGHNRDYAPAREAYTDPDNPNIAGKNVRFIFTTQAVIQRHQHPRFLSAYGKHLTYSHVVIDEFDFTSGLIPTLDYVMTNMSNPDIRSTSEKTLLRWVQNNYTKFDADMLRFYKANHKQGFTLAHWVEACDCPLTFLTSEILAAQILTSLNFIERKIPSQDHSDCTINLWHSRFINKLFFQEMNKEVAWNKLNYDLIISDSVKPYFDNSYDSLEITVIPHSGIRGSNSWVNKNILTVVSYIPPVVISEIADCLSFFGTSLARGQVESLFYRDRLCQAVGRVLGNRGGKRTDVITHTSIFEGVHKVSDFPYTINTDWQFNFDGFMQIQNRLSLAKAEQRTQRTIYRKSVSKARSLSHLDLLFEVDNTSFLTYVEVKNHLTSNHVVGATGTAILPVSKVIKYFESRGVVATQKRVQRKLINCVFGLRIKQ
jgi:hypothetical protein